MNPKIYFKITNEVLIPIKGQSNILDTLFLSSAVLDRNKAGYNDYTKEFINNNKNNYNVYKSENYSWDPDLNTFNFKSLEDISEDEYFSAANYKTQWKHDVAYDFINIKEENTTIDLDNIKKEASNLKLDTNTDFLGFIKNNFPKPSIENCGMYIDDFTWNYLVRNILKKKSTLLIGPTGTGKTELVMLIAEKLNIPCKVYDMGSMQDPLTDLLGSHRLENGSSIFDYAKFTKDIQEPCIIVLDELSRAPLMANNILFPCLDKRRELPVEIAGSKDIRNIKVHPDVVFIATANIGIEYSGTNTLDAALLNRFLPLQLGYIPAKNEIDVLVNRTGISENQAVKLVNFANKIRKDYKEETLSKSCSTRETIAMAEMLADGFSYLEAITSVIIHKYTDSLNDEVAHIQRLLISI